MNRIHRTEITLFPSAIVIAKRFKTQNKT